MKSASVSQLVWSLRTDKSQRPGVGKTEAMCHKQEHKLVFSGELAMLNGTFGPVGFATISTQWPFRGMAQAISFTAYQSDEFPGRQFACLVKDKQWDQPHGILTFQHAFVIGGAPRKVSLPLTQFEAKIRGKYQAGFSLDLASIWEVSFQIARSEQPQELKTVDPLLFSLTLEGVICAESQH